MANMKYLLNCRSFISLMVLFSFFDNFGMEKDDYTFKVLIVGDAAVGKTQIVNKFINNSFFEKYNFSMGMNFGTKKINFNGKNIRLYLWDTPGQEKYRELMPSSLEYFHLIAIVYAVDNQGSFNNISERVNKIKPKTNKKTKFLLVGNKCDLVEKRQVTKEDAENYAKANKMEFIEISAKAGTNIEKMFNSSLLKILEDENNIENEKKQIDNYSHIDINHNNNLPFCNKYCSCCLCLKKSEGNVEEEEEIEYGE